MLWDHLIELTGHKTRNNKLPTDIDANAVNDFFINLGPSTVANLHASKYHHNNFVHYVPHTFSMSQVSAVELKKVVNTFPSKNLQVLMGFQ